MKKLDKFMPLHEVMTAAGLCRTQIYDLIKDGRFPPPLKLGKASRWAESQMLIWQDIVVRFGGLPDTIPRGWWNGEMTENC